MTTDGRFLDVLRAAGSAVLDATGEGRNGEVFMAWRTDPAADDWSPADRYPEAEWIADQVDGFLREPADPVAGPLRVMLEARARLGQNIRLIEDIRLDRIRTALLDPDEAPAVSDDISALLDFVAEVRKIAKEI